MEREVRKMAKELNVVLDEKAVVYMYGHFTKEINKLKEMMNSPNNPIDKKSIEEQIRICEMITVPLSQQYPNLCKIDEYLKK